MDQLKELEFAKIPAGSYELGWRFTSQLPKPVLDTIEEFLTLKEFLTRFSPRRTVTVPSFSIATTSARLYDLLGNPYEWEDVSTICEVCNKPDSVLNPLGFRMPTEDEMEIACGGELFTWGMTIPDGEPYGDRTSFALHAGPNQFGLQLSGNTYEPELTREAFKLGDGGCAVCGGYPSPIAWFTLSPSHRLIDVDIEEFFTESLEEARVRPIRIRSD